MKPGCSLDTCQGMVDCHMSQALWCLPLAHGWLNSGQVKAACFLLAYPPGPWVLQPLS